MTGLGVRLEFRRAAHLLQASSLPCEVISYAVWLYFRFTLSFRDVEELLAERGIEVSYERSAAGR